MVINGIRSMLVAVAMGHVLAGCRAQSSCGPAHDPPAAARRPEARKCASIGRWQYHFDRNSLVASAVVGEHVLAIAEAGHFLRFSRDSLQATGERLSGERALVFGEVRGGSVLVGFEGGRIARVDAATWSIEHVAMVPGAPKWLGTMPGTAQTVVVYELDAEPPEPRSQRVRILETDRDFSLGTSQFHAFFIDPRGTLWLGMDRREFGGALGAIDLTQIQAMCSLLNKPGKSSVAWPPADPPHGFLTDERGAVLAFGGYGYALATGHPFVFEVSRTGAPKSLFSSAEFLPSGDGIPAEMSRPILPIRHVLSVGRDRFVVISGEHIFETDGQFQAWKPLAHLDLCQIDEGEGDSITRCASIHAAHLIADRLVLATHGRGFIEVVGGKVIAHTLPHQHDTGDAKSAFLWGETLIVRPEHGALMAFRDGNWQKAHLLIDPSASARTLLARALADTHDAVAMKDDALLVATDGRLCVRTRTDSTCKPLPSDTSSASIEVLARDSSGRIWLGGRGFSLDEKGDFVRYDAEGSFLQNVLVKSLAVTGDRLVVTLGENWLDEGRGIAVIDTKSLTSPALCRPR